MHKAKKIAETIALIAPEHYPQIVGVCHAYFSLIGENPKRQESIEETTLEQLTKILKSKA